MSEDPEVVELKDIDYRIQQLILRKQQYNSNHVKSDGITDPQKALIIKLCTQRGLDQPQDLSRWTKKEAHLYIDGQLKKR